MQMFRGESEDVIARRLMLRGWPELAAKRMAAYLCDRRSQPPRWHELVGDEDA